MTSYHHHPPQKTQYLQYLSWSCPDKDKFQGPSSTDSNYHGNICQGNICPGGIFPYRKYPNYYQPKNFMNQKTFLDPISKFFFGPKYFFGEKNFTPQNILALSKMTVSTNMRSQVSHWKIPVSYLTLPVKVTGIFQ